MKLSKLFAIIIILFAIFSIILITSCNSGMTPINPETPTVDNSLKEGIIVDIQAETITEDSSNDRAVTGAILGGVGGYLLSKRPSITKTLLSAGAGAAVGKMSGGKLTQYTNYNIYIKTGIAITTRMTRNNSHKVGDTVLYNNEMLLKKN